MSNLQKDLMTKDGVKIHYEICNLNKGSLALIFLHGLGGNLTAWNKERTYFHKRNVSTIAIDLRGQGLSDDPKNLENFKMEGFVKDVLEIIQNENIKRCVLVGHCLGGMVSLILAAKYPKAINALILIDTSYKAPFFEKPIENNSFVIKTLKLLAKYSPNIEIKEEVDNNIFKNSTELNIVRIASDILHTSLKSYLYACKEFIGFDATKLLNQILCPTLIIQGTKDIIIPPKTAEYLQKRIKNSYIDYIPGANHILVINNPLDLGKEMYKFIINI